MADSAVPITSGSGTNIDTRTEATNGNHRQVVVVGDPSTNDGVAPVDSTRGVKVDVADVITDDAAFTPGTSKVLPVAAEYDDTTPDSVDEGDAGALRMSANRNLYVRIRDNAGNERGLNIDANGELGISAIRSALPAGTNAIGKLSANSGVDIGDTDVTSVIPGTGATNLGKAEDAIHSSGDTGVMALAVRDDTLDARSGAENDYEPLHTDANGALWTHPTDTIAHDAADSGNGIKVTAKAETALSGVTLVADGDRTNLYAGVDGVLITRPHCNLEDIVSGNASNTDGTSTQVIASSGAGVKTYLTSITITNTSSSNIYVELKDGTTVKWTFPVPANGGVTHTWNVPLAGSAATAWNFDPSAATTTVYCSALGFKSKV